MATPKNPFFEMDRLRALARKACAKYAPDGMRIEVGEYQDILSIRIAGTKVEAEVVHGDDSIITNRYRRVHVDAGSYSCVSNGGWLATLKFSRLLRAAAEYASFVDRGGELSDKSIKLRFEDYPLNTQKMIRREYKKKWKKTFAPDNKRRDYYDWLTFANIL